MNKQEIITKIRANRALLEEFSVKSISVFGSAVRDGLRPDSNVDILVEFHSNARISLFTFVHFKNQLSDLLGCSEDLVTPDALHPALKEEKMGEFMSHRNWRFRIQNILDAVLQQLLLSPEDQDS